MSANPSARPVSTRRSFLAAGTAVAAIGAPVAIAASTSDLEADLRKALAVLQAAEDASNAADLAADAACDRLDDMGGPFPPLPEAVYEREGDEALKLHARHIAPDGRAMFAPWFIKSMGTHPRERSVIRWEATPSRREREQSVHVRVVNGVREYGYSSREPWPEAEARAVEIRAAFAEHEAEIERREVVSGYRAAHEANDRVQEAYRAAQDRVIDTLARTKAGADMKLDLLLAWHEGGDAVLDWSVENGGGSQGARLAFSIIRDLRNLRREA